MLTRRTALGLLVSVAAISGALAEPKGDPKKKQQQHKNGHGLAKGRLKQNGRHQIDKAGQASVSVDVNNGKITGMSASHPQKGNLATRKVKSRKKMAAIEHPPLRLAANGDIQLAQADVYYYAWVFDDGFVEYYYWYPAEVIIVDTSWIEVTF